MSSRNVPVPEVVHKEEVADPPIDPSVANVDPSQIVAAAPAEVVAIGLMVKTMASIAAAQGPAPSGSSVVIVKVTPNAAISAAEGQGPLQPARRSQPALSNLRRSRGSLRISSDGYERRLVDPRHFEPN